MSKIIATAACAAALSFAVSAIAQTTSGAPSSSAATGASKGTTSSAPMTGSSMTGSSADTAATASSPQIVTGMSVKDNTGALIGEITAVKPDASGQDLATVKMGSDSFTVETSKLAVANGAATINATKSELKAMLPKK